MKPAIYDVLNIELFNDLMNIYGYFKSKLKSLYFDGYLKYNDSVSIEKKIDLDIYEKINEYELKSCIYKYKIVEPPQLYTESTIVKKLESSGVGRPSTYANLIETLYNRKYTISTDIDEITKSCSIIELNENNEIIEKIEEYTIPKQKNKILVTELGEYRAEFSRCSAPRAIRSLDLGLSADREAVEPRDTAQRCGDDIHGEDR